MTDAVTSIDDVLGQIRPATTAVRICLQGDLTSRHERLSEQLATDLRLDAMENRIPEAPKIALQIEELEEQIRASEVEFTFQAISRKQYTDLEAQHPATDDQRRDYQAAWNPDTFPQALVAASCTLPTGVTEAKAQQLAEALSFGQWQKLWRACLAVNLDGADAPFSGAAFAVLHGSEKKSEQPGTTASPAASS